MVTRRARTSGCEGEHIYLFVHLEAHVATSAPRLAFGSTRVGWGARGVRSCA